MHGTSVIEFLGSECRAFRFCRRQCGYLKPLATQAASGLFLFRMLDPVSSPADLWREARFSETVDPQFLGGMVTID